MSGDTLYVFEIKHPTSVSYTSLSRLRGEAVDLPPLASWLDTPTLDIDRIEILSKSDLKDLQGIGLYNYIDAGYGIEGGVYEVTEWQHDLNYAAQGEGILIVPARALGRTLTEEEAGRDNPNLILVSEIRLAQADNSASLPKADIHPTPSNSAPTPAPGAPRNRPIVLYVLLAIGVATLLGILVGRG